MINEEFSDWIQIQTHPWIFKTHQILFSKKKRHNQKTRFFSQRCRNAIFEGNVFFWENGRVVQVVRACDGKVQTSEGNLWKQHVWNKWNMFVKTQLGGAFKHFLFSPLFGEMIRFWLIFFRCVETTN